MLLYKVRRGGIFVKENKKNIVIVFLIIIILALIVLLFFQMNNKTNKVENKNPNDSNIKDEMEQEPEPTPNEEEEIPELTDERTKKLLEKAATYVSISGNLNDSNIYYLLMEFIEENQPSNYSNGTYNYTISKEQFINDLYFINSTKSVDSVFAIEPGNYNNYKTTSDNINYIISAGGHGKTTNKVLLQDSKIENGKYIFTYNATCANDKNTDETLNIGTVVMTLSYNKDNKKYTITDTKFNQTMQNYSCFWT